MKCLRCGNTDPSYFYKGSRGWYCRKCISFSRLLLEEEPQSLDYEIVQGADEYHFTYELTPQQQQASHKCLAQIAEGDVLLYCVCGAGKTEITVETISAFLAKGQKVCFAISRREVVIELQQRFARIFSKAKVTGVYGGHHEVLDGDLIVCTCHQLYRYYRSFDLLIIDEVDAFPLKGNETLLNIAVTSCRGHIIYSTATVDDQLLHFLSRRPYARVELFVRPSQEPLSVPKLYIVPKVLSLFLLARIMSLSTNRCLIFVSGRQSARRLCRLFSPFFACTYVHADLAEREENIRCFREGKKRCIFATSVLERGITIENVDVIIMNFGRIFDQSNLIQMLGRVGRGLNSKGNSYIISDHVSKEVEKTMNYLNEANKHL